MSIKDYSEKVKAFLQPFYTLLLCLVIGAIFFALGRLSAIEERHGSVKIIQAGPGQTANVISSIDSGNEVASTSVEAAVSGSGEVIGSKTGNKYYFPWCGTVKRIKPENQVHFATVDAARAAGYTAGGNCKGLE